MDRLTDLSLKAAIALENVLLGREADSTSIAEFVSALEGEVHAEDWSKKLMGDYERVDLYNQALMLTGDTPKQLKDLCTQVATLLESMHGDLEKSSEDSIKKARDFCLAINRALVDADYENLRETSRSARISV